jgi:hypothetical protein
MKAVNLEAINNEVKLNSQILNGGNMKSYVIYIDPAQNVQVINAIYSDMEEFVELQAPRKYMTIPEWIEFDSMEWYKKEDGGLVFKTSDDGKANSILIIVRGGWWIKENIEQVYASGPRIYLCPLEGTTFTIEGVNERYEVWYDDRRDVLHLEKIN